MGSILTSMSTTSSCQPLPHHHQAMGSVTGPERVNSGLNTVSGAKANVFSGKIVGSLFPRLRAWICKSGRQKVHRTLARARFHIKIIKETESPRPFLEDGVGKMCTRL